MSAAAQERHTPATLGRFVIPVRYVARGEVMQTTSTALTPRAVHVRSVEPPNAGLIVGLKLYFPSSGEVVLRSATVTGVTSDATPGFWAHFSDDVGDGRIAELLAQHREMGDRGCVRAKTDVPAVIRAREQDEVEARVVNLSRSGAFVEVDACPPLGAVVELKLGFPAVGPEARALAMVVHHAPGGMGVQFIGGTDVFRSRLDQHLAPLAA